MTPTLVRRYPRLVKEAESEPGFDVLEVDPEQRNIFGVVKGLDGLSLDEIEDTAHDALGRIFKSDGRETFGQHVYPVESGIAPVDFPMGGRDRQGRVMVCGIARRRSCRVVGG